MHRGGEYEDTKYRRDMRRTTIREGAAELADDPFTDLFVASGPSAFTSKAPAAAN
ncbi:MAG: hypothetical protein WDM92_03995 [Caulobacteraceae bacterium]